MIEVHNLVKVFEGRGTPVRAVDHVSTRISKGEVVVVIGPSGSGKSTFLRCLNGLEAFDDGQVIIDGVDLGVEKMLRRIGFQYCNRIDPFDGGPHLRANTDEILLVKRCHRGKAVALPPDTRPDGPKSLVAVNLKETPYFRAVPAYVRVRPDGQVELTHNAATFLNLTDGADVVVLPLD